MKALVLAACLAVLSVGPLIAQSDPMEMQRCVWRCLANSSGASDPRYHMCVEAVCSRIGEPQVQVPQVPNAQSWVAGTATDGVTRYAGILGAEGAAQGLYYMCTFRGQSYLALFGFEGPGATLQVQVDGVAYAVNFHRNRGELTFDIPGNSPFLDNLPRGQRLRVVTGAGNLLLDVPLSGAWAAINRTKRACFG